MLDLALFVGSVSVWVAVLRRLLRRETLLPLAPRLPVPWRGLDVVVLASLVLFLELAAASFGAAPTSADPLASLTAESLSLRLALRLGWVVLGAVYLVFGCGAYADDLGWDTSRWRGDARLALLGFLAALLPVYGLQAFVVYVLKIPSAHPIVELMKSQPSTPLMTLTTLVAVIGAPISEEFAFRVLLQGWLERQQVRLRERRTGIWDPRPGYAPLVVSSVVFALLHLGHGADPAALFVFSLFLGYVYRQTHRIFPSLLMHAALNGVTMAALWVQVYAPQA